MTTARLEAFSDAVFAIAITLLVLGIRIPHVADGQLGHALLAAWPWFATYAFSFTIVGLLWASHHNLFRLVKHVNRPLLLLNLAMLLCIAFVPFPTGLLGEYVGSPLNQKIAEILLSGTVALSGILYNVIWYYASRNNLLVERLTPADIQKLQGQFLLSPPLVMFTMLLAFVSPNAVLVAYLFLVIFYAGGYGFSSAMMNG